MTDQPFPPSLQAALNQLAPGAQQLNVVFAKLSAAFARAILPWIKVEDYGTYYRVSFSQPYDREVEMKRWLRERGHKARYETPRDVFSPSYVKCSKDTALLFKLTFGGA